MTTATGVAITRAPTVIVAAAGIIGAAIAAAATGTTDTATGTETITAAATETATETCDMPAV
jgi:hypothetical protein